MGDVRVNTDPLHRYRLIGDEDCGVGIECREHPDGGRPLAYYDAGLGRRYADDPAVVNVSTIPGLLTAAMVHEHEAHREPPLIRIDVDPRMTPEQEARLLEAWERFV